MSSATLDPPKFPPPMARQKPKSRPVKIEDAIVTQAELVASRRERDGRRMNVSEYLSDLLRELVQRDYLKTLEELQKEAETIRKRRGG
jgi:hypothetical protein